MTPYAESVAADATRFVELSPDQTGVDFVQPIDTAHPLKAIYAGDMLHPESRLAT